MLHFHHGYYRTEVKVVYIVKLYEFAAPLLAGRRLVDFFWHCLLFAFSVRTDIPNSVVYESTTDLEIWAEAHSRKSFISLPSFRTLPLNPGFHNQRGRQRGRESPKELISYLESILEQDRPRRPRSHIIHVYAMCKSQNAPDL